MWESTHLQTSSKVQDIQDSFSTTQCVLDFDTSFCEKYDEAGVAPIKQAGITQHMHIELDKAYDYFYHNEEEGTSP
jgi:hypothetical protein